MTTTLTPLMPGHFYHIYNRGINGELLFKTTENHRYFLRLVAKHLLGAAKVYAYCMMANHFHLLVAIREDLTGPPHLHLSRLFNSYAQAFNRQQKRTGGLFERPFRRKIIDSEEYLVQLIYYIHRNPAHHAIECKFSNYEHSSYKCFLSNL